jgi:signal transduction histidine kinase
MITRTDNSVAGTQLPFFAQFRTRLILLVLLVFIPAMALVIHANLRQRGNERAKARESVAALAKLTASKQENFLKNTRQLLVTLAEFPFLVRHDNGPLAQSHFANLRKILPDYLDFGIIEADGTLFCSVEAADGVVTMNDRSYYQRVIETRRFEVGDLQSGGLSEKPTLDFGFPILSEEGLLIRVLYASLNLDLLSGAVAEAQLPAEAVATVFDRRGNILARHPAPQQWVGKSMSNEPLVRRALSHTEGIFEVRGIDGIHRQYAVAPVSAGRNPSLFVSVGIPSEVSFAAANQMWIRSLLLFGIVAVLALSSAHFYSRRFLMDPVSSLVRTATALAQGDMSVRTVIPPGHGELNELAQHLDVMAARLQRRQNELENAQVEISRMNLDLEQRVKERTAELEVVNRELESFSYSVSHDLRAPLRHIQGYAKMLAMSTEGQLPEKALRYLKTIIQASVEMGQLIDDLLAFSRMGRIELIESRVALGDAVQSMIQEMQMAAAGRNIVWKVGPLPEVCVDPAMIKQVWVNLLGNAVKYSRRRDPALIEIGRAGEEDGRVILFVRDNGAGFDMRYAHKLFGVFQRLHRADEFEGIGIGLATVRRIVSRHGGRT